jgi:hypothetical protein
MIKTYKKLIKYLKLLVGGGWVVSELAFNVLRFTAIHSLKTVVDYSCDFLKIHYLIETCKLHYIFLTNKI